ncbi:MAG: SMP-30/gluconolactonase/LRE family protein, partial [Pseudomonadota bacterium]|nr:SMP-30/gluconolactonase/LRE family protein [Pseudomonadota bacterium]
DRLPAPARYRPTDLVFSPAGCVVFTNPRTWEAVGRDDAAYAGGQLVLAKPDGTTVLLAEPDFPNGLAFHPDGSLLVGLTTGHRVVRYAWKGGAPLGAPEPFCQLHDMFHSDGMVVSGERVYVAGSVCNEIAVLDLSGTCLRLIDFGRGSGPTNLCVRGDRLWVTLGKAGRVVSIPAPV